MNILVIGQATLHWGRLEFGNIGNFYIIEPFFQELHRVFPDAAISTTFQLSEGFCKRERLRVIPMGYYYAWGEDNLKNALHELSCAYIYSRTGHLPRSTPYLETVLQHDLIIDLSGDMWGDNADFLGEDRFLVGLIKDRVPQLLGKPTVMLAGSPGPFHKQATIPFAQEVFEHFDLVTNREPISTELLSSMGFDTSRVRDCACPSFLFKPAPAEELERLNVGIRTERSDRPNVGFIICGWNFLQGPFDRWPREDDEYSPYVHAIDFLTHTLHVNVYLMSHANGFPLPPAEFKLIHGRDFPIVKQLHTIVQSKGMADNVFLLDGVYDPHVTKAIIAQFDMLISGRIHGAIAGLSQNVPTVIIDYGHGPKAHKLRGFARLMQVEEYVADPADETDLVHKISSCWSKRELIKKHLENHIPLLQDSARENFNILRELYGKHEHPG
ncbi:MAG TPA: polysaccharide pyruvyl transferase family protein [Deltaproteobacteria bacterium]|nr:polysaccharide pyruvyl transferase family protein [Deltaproteobacteria bacterium]